MVSIYKRTEVPTLQILRPCEECAKLATKHTEVSVETDRVVLVSHVVCGHKGCSHEMRMSPRILQMRDILDKITEPVEPEAAFNRKAA